MWTVWSRSFPDCGTALWLPSTPPPPPPQLCACEWRTSPCGQVEAAPWSGSLQQGPQNLLITGSSLFLNHKDGHKSPKECEQAGWGASELQTGAGQLCRLVAPSCRSWGNASASGCRSCTLPSARTGREPCVTEMKTKSNSCGLKSKTGCLWESNMMWFLISFSLM